jgi:hypothetical protein
MASRRGTTNRNQRGNTRDRSARRAWLVATFQANHSMTPDGKPCPSGQGAKACRCYRCGTLLTYATVTIDRIVPGNHGGTYRRNNIRPACAKCNSGTAHLAWKRKS